MSPFHLSDQQDAYSHHKARNGWVANHVPGGRYMYSIHKPYRFRRTHVQEVYICQCSSQSKLWTLSCAREAQQTKPVHDQALPLKADMVAQVTKAKQAGAVILAKVNLSEWAFSATTSVRLLLCSLHISCCQNCKSQHVHGRLQQGCPDSSIL